MMGGSREGGSSRSYVVKVPIVAGWGVLSRKKLRLHDVEQPRICIDPTHVKNFTLNSSRTALKIKLRQKI